MMSYCVGPGAFSKHLIVLGNNILLKCPIMLGASVLRT